MLVDMSNQGQEKVSGTLNSIELNMASSDFTDISEEKT